MNTLQTPVFSLPQSFIQEIKDKLSQIYIKELGLTFGDLNIFQKAYLKDETIQADLLFPTFGLKEEAKWVDMAREMVLKTLLASGFSNPLEINVFAKTLPANKQSLLKPGVYDVKNIILIASGKGGVGKSTLASNLAVTLSKLGCSVGLVDADVYGPSAPTLFGILPEETVQAVQVEGEQNPYMLPLLRHGIRLMSIGFLVDTTQPMVWRGPMIASACMQMFQQVVWGDVDYLIVDLPPGTGDIQLTLSQKLSVSGAVIVSTPQTIAIADVKRAKAMFDKVNIPVLGVVENMSYFVCDHCEHKHHLFHHGGAKQMAQALELPFLAEIPFESPLQIGADTGKPAVLSKSRSSVIFEELAYDLCADLVKRAYAFAKNPPADPPKPPQKTKKTLSVLN